MFINREKMMKKTDTRVQYTKHVLQEALLQLLKKKNIERISVKELCDEAGINRGTFYLHYSAPNDILREIEEDFIRTHFDKYITYLDNEYELSSLSHMFASILQNIELCKVIMGPNGNPKFLKRIKEQMRPEMVKQWKKEFPNYRTAHLDYVFDYIFSGSMSLILNWIDDEGKTSISVEELANRLDRLGHYCHLSIKEFH